MAHYSLGTEGSPCLRCRLSKLCLPIALDSSDIKYLESIVEQYTLKKGEYLYRQNNNFHAVYAVRSGSFKSFTINYNGDTHINGFFFPGELIGLDGLENRIHINNMQALEQASVCQIHFSRLKDLSLKIPKFQNHFFSLMGREINEGQEINSLLSKRNAEQRVVHLLLSIAQRLERLSLSSNNFFLPMARTDIGIYLGLTTETVSRIFSQLQNKKLISVSNREIKLLDLESLQEIIECSGAKHACQVPFTSYLDERITAI